MHPSIAQRVTALEGLRARAQQATAEFYQKPGVQPPPLAPLIIVRPSGNNTFTLINRATGVVVAERFGHNNATKHARELESKVALSSLRKDKQLSRGWVFRISVTLVLLAYLGCHL